MEEAADGSTQAVDGLSSKMQSAFSEIGVSIVDQNGDLRSTYDILVDIGQKWPELSAEQKTYYSELAAGKNQANIFAALMQNIGTAVNATNTALNSNGSAVEENAKRMDSVQGKIEQFQAAWEKLTTSFMSSDFLKGIIDAGTALVKFFDTDMGKATAGAIGFAAAVALIGPKIVSLIGNVKNLMVIGKLFKVFDGADEVIDAFGRMGGAVDGTTRKMTGFVGAFKGLAPALGLVGGAIALIGAAGATIAWTRDRERESHAALTEQTETMIKQYDTAKGKVEGMASQIDTLKAKVEELKKKGEEEGGLGIDDQATLQKTQQELDALIAKYEFLQKQAYLASEQVTKALKEELFATNRVGMGMGSLSNQQMNMVEETAGLTAALTRNRAEYDALTEAGKQNSVEGRTLANTIKHQEEAFGTLTPRLQEIHDQLMQGGEAEQQMAKELEPLILNATRATEGTNNLAKAAANMKENVKTAMIEIEGGKKSTVEVGESFLQLASSFAAGGTTIEGYYGRLQTTFDSMNMDKLDEAYRQNAENAGKLTDEQRALLETAEMLQLGMADVYQRMTEDGFEYTEANAQMYSDSVDAMLELYGTEQGIWKDKEGNWQGANQEAIQYVQSIEEAKAAMESYGSMADWVAGQQQFLTEASNGAWDSMINGSAEAKAQAEASMAEFTSGFVTQMNELRTSNQTAFDDMVTKISEASGIAKQDLLDANGFIRSDLNLTADQAAKIGTALQEGAATGMDGIKSKISEAIASASGEFSKITTAATQAGNQGGDGIKQGIVKGAQAGIAEGQSQFSSAEFKNDKAKVSVGTVDSSKWDNYPLAPRYATVIVNEVQGTKIGKASGDDFIDRSGFYTVGEAGRETVFLPRGSAVATASETRNMRGMLKSGRGASYGEGIKIDDDITDSFAKIANSLVKVTKALTNVSITPPGQQAPAPTPQSRSASMARAASYDDPHKKAFDSAYDELKYLQDMDRISEQDYLNRLENLNNSYFGGRMDYLEEYRRYEVEVYKGRKKIQEQVERDREQAEKDRIKAVKDNFKKEEDALEYMRDKDLITEEDYYRQLAALNDKYYKGKTEYLDEYQKYEIKVYDYLKKKEEERLKELEEKTEKQYENTKDYIVDMIDKQIEAEEGKLEQLDKEKEQQEKLKAIEEARKKLAEAQSQKVMVYRAGQGFVYESDAAAIEEASKELNELLEEERFDEQSQAIEDEIQRLEDLKDAWQDSLDINDDFEKYGVLLDWIKAFEEANYEDRLNMADQFKESYKKALQEIADAQANISNTASAQLPNFKPNGYASGSDYIRRDEKAIVGENGPELVNLPKGSGVLTATETQNMRAWGSISPVNLFSGINKLLSSAPRFSFDAPEMTQKFDFTGWNVGIEDHSGLIDAIQNNLRETVIQYISKRDR